MRLVTVPEGTLVGFKALPTWDPSLVQPGNPASRHVSNGLWSGLYPQLSFQSAVNYLPNQWDRGHEEASIVKLVSNADLTFLVSDNPHMAKPEITSVQKAEIIAKEVEELLGSSINPQVAILEQLGKLSLNLCILDAEDFELVVPHTLLDKLNIEVLFRFQVNHSLPGITGSVDAHPLPKHIVQDPAELGIALSQDVSDPNCDNMRRILGISLNQL